jgi:uncharacterized protein
MKTCPGLKLGLARARVYFHGKGADVGTIGWCRNVRQDWNRTLSMAMSAEQKLWLSNFRRRFRYLYLRLIALRGSPRELALGMSLGVFIGMMPIMPFQIAVAVALALLCKASKITAAIGTWISNPVTWYGVYYYDYKLGSFLLGIPPEGALFSSVMTVFEAGETSTVVITKILGTGGKGLAVFLLGGFTLGVLVAVPSYFIWLSVFRYIRAKRISRRKLRR